MNQGGQPPAQLLKTGAVYARLMEEVKRREAAISATVKGEYALPAPIASDLCYVQLRKICELIGLSCLVAHGDLPGVKTKTMQKEYRPDVIIRQLEKLHPGFYPKPTLKIPVPGESHRFHAEDIKEGYLSKAALIELYGECGDRLHRGSVRKILAGKEPSVDLERVDKWRHQVITLLNHHHIFTTNPDFHLIIQMQTHPNNQVPGSVFQALRPTESNSPRR